jgi:hypothetical protein
MMIDKYVLDGKTPRKVESSEEWANWFEIANRHVAQSLFGLVHVSTVFLGIDYNFLGGPPLIFETMIFNGLHDGYRDRCSTWEEAEAMHERACALVKAEVDSPNPPTEATK